MPWKLSADSRISAQAVERQMRNWELARTQHRERTAVGRPEVEDFVTVSREAGAPAEDVAALIGQRLGWPVFGRNLLDFMAGEDTLRHQIYQSLDQRDLKWWEEALFGMFRDGYVRNDYFRLLCETVLSLARQSCCVFVGRGCDRLLPGELGYRLRLVAPLDLRIETAAREHHLTSREAREWIARTERARDEFLHRHFGVTASDPTRHDLTLNLGRMGAEEAVELLLAGRRLRRRQATSVASAR